MDKLSENLRNKKIIIVGGHEQACMMLDYLIENEFDVVMCIARQDDKGQDTIFPSLLARARKYDIPTLQTLKLNTPKVLSSVIQFDADIVLSLQNNMIFKSDWLHIFDNKLGIVNVHYAPLPRYGGYWPEMWAIWNDEKEFAVTMHYVEEGIDSGCIIAQSFFDIDPLESRKSLYDKSTAHCFSMLKANIHRILENRVLGSEQDKSRKTYYPKSLPNDGILDLSWDKETQNRFIRAISFPGFIGPKIKIGDQVLSICAEDVPFFTPFKISY